MCCSTVFQIRINASSIRSQMDFTRSYILSGKYQHIISLSFNRIYSLFTNTNNYTPPMHFTTLSRKDRWQFSHHGSNSWMMLSNLMTAKRRELKPTSHANASIANDRRLFQPPGFHIDVLMSVFTPASAIFAAVTTFRSINQWNFATVLWIGWLLFQSLKWFVTVYNHNWEFTDHRDLWLGKLVP